MCRLRQKNCILVNESIILDVQSEQCTSLHMTDFRLVEMWRVTDKVWGVECDKELSDPVPWPESDSGWASLSVRGWRCEVGRKWEAETLWYFVNKISVNSLDQIISEELRTGELLLWGELAGSSLHGKSDLKLIVSEHSYQYIRGNNLATLPPRTVTLQDIILSPSLYHLLLISTGAK